MQRPLSLLCCRKPKGLISWPKIFDTRIISLSLEHFQTTNHNVQNPHKTREEQRNELHLHSHEQHRLTQARIIENGLYPETNKYIYEVNIPDLKPDRTYVVQVKATNKFHEGEWSEKFLFRTSGRGKCYGMNMCFMALI